MNVAIFNVNGNHLSAALPATVTGKGAALDGAPAGAKAPDIGFPVQALLRSLGYGAVCDCQEGWIGSATQLYVT